MGGTISQLRVDWCPFHDGIFFEPPASISRVVCSMLHNFCPRKANLFVKGDKPSLMRKQRNETTGRDDYVQVLRMVSIGRGCFKSDQIQHLEVLPVPVLKKTLSWVQ